MNPHNRTSSLDKYHYNTNYLETLEREQKEHMDYLQSSMNKVKEIYAGD